MFPAAFSSSGAIDTDNDGYIDRIFITGAEFLPDIDYSQAIVNTRFYDLTPHGESYFTENTSINFPGASGGAALVRDVNKDGHADIFLMGGKNIDYIGTPDFIAHLYLGNADGSYTLHQELTGMANNATATYFDVDTNNDGIRELHLMTSGRIMNGDRRQLIIYQYADGKFTEVYSETNTAHTVVRANSLVLNRDTDISDEILVMGNSIGYPKKPFIIDYRNGSFVIDEARSLATSTDSFPGMESTALGIVSGAHNRNYLINSGYVDAETGNITETHVVYDGVFSPVDLFRKALEGYKYGEIVVYDFDQDGDDDVYITGVHFGKVYADADVYINDNGSFSGVPDTGFTPVAMAYPTSMIIDVWDAGPQKLMISTGNTSKYSFGNEIVAKAYVLSGSALSVDDINTEHIEIFPNPVIDELQLSLGNADIDHIQIYNMTGKSVLVGTVVDDRISLGHLSAGVYLLEVRTSKGSTLRKKIVKN